MQWCHTIFTIKPTHINKNFSWLADLEKLFSDFELIDKTKMWFNKNWKNNFET